MQPQGTPPPSKRRRHPPLPSPHWPPDYRAGPPDYRAGPLITAPAYNVGHINMRWGQSMRQNDWKPIKPPISVAISEMPASRRGLPPIHNSMRTETFTKWRHNLTTERREYPGIGRRRRREPNLTERWSQTLRKRSINSNPTKLQTPKNTKS